MTIAPADASFWNTLGVAAYRSGDWKTASEALEKSMSLHQGGDAFDWFFLAMTRWRQNQPDEAKRWLDQANEWAEKNENIDQRHRFELRQFQAEARDLIKVAKLPTTSNPAVKG